MANSDNPFDSCLQVDSRKKQVLLRDTQPVCLDKQGIIYEKAPKMFSFDMIFDQDATLAQTCAGTLVDLLHSVVDGNDACLLTYGYPKLGE